MNELIVQGIGVIAYIVLVASYYRKEKAQILAMQIIAYLIFTVHYQFLNRNNRGIMQFYRCHNDVNNIFI